MLVGLLAMCGVFVAVGTIARLIIQRFQRKPPNPLTDKVIESVALEGDVITAIRWHRELHGSSLTDAKAAVEGIVAQHKGLTSP